MRATRGRPATVVTFFPDSYRSNRAKPVSFANTIRLSIHTFVGVAVPSREFGFLERQPTPSVPREIRRRCHPCGTVLQRGCHLSRPTRTTLMPPPQSEKCTANATHLRPASAGLRWAGLLTPSIFRVSPRGLPQAFRRTESDRFAACRRQLHPSMRGPHSRGCAREPPAPDLSDDSFLADLGRRARGARGLLRSRSCGPARRPCGDRPRSGTFSPADWPGSP